jgi:hypothetical protein
MRTRRVVRRGARAPHFARVTCVLALLASAPACVQVRWEKSRFLRPVPRAATSSLAPGASLAECVQRLGAPYFVWEQPQGAVTLGYAWQLSKGWGFGVSGSIVKNVDASFDFDDLDAHTHGFALWFDPAWKLERIEFGRLRDLHAPAPRPRPNFIGLTPAAGSPAAAPRATEPQ